MPDIKIEFAVQMKCEDCVEKIKKCLSNVEGIHNVSISLKDESVLVETNLPALQVLERLESTGRRAVLKGYGDLKHRGAAVAILGDHSDNESSAVRGVVRFLQVDSDSCIVDGTIDGLQPGLHGIHVHECGDISGGCESVGDHFNPLNTFHGGPNDSPENRHAGDLGNIAANNEGRATFRFEDNIVKVWDIIGRSVVITESEDDLGRGDTEASLKNGNSGKRIACGIIARAAGLFENPKKICACDGVSIWDEKNRPLAGPGRRNPQT